MVRAPSRNYLRLASPNRGKYELTPESGEACAALTIVTKHRGRGDEARPVGADAMGKQVHVDGVIHEIVIYCVVHVAKTIAVVPPRLPPLKV